MVLVMMLTTNSFLVIVDQKTVWVILLEKVQDGELIKNLKKIKKLVNDFF